MGASGAVPGDTLTWTVTAGNAGPSAMVTDLTVTDTVSGDVTITSAVGDGWTCTIDASARCTRAPIGPGKAPPITVTGVLAGTATGTVTNTATVGSVLGDPRPANNTSSVSTPVTSYADLSVTSYVTNGRLPAGASTTWTVLVDNRGPVPAADVLVVATFPAQITPTSAAGDGWTCTVAASVQCRRPSAAVGAARPISIRGQVSISADGTLSTPVAVSSAMTDPNPTNNSSTLTTPVTRWADLTIHTDLIGAVQAGAPHRWTTYVTNYGPVPARDVVLVTQVDPAVRSVTGAGDGWTCLTQDTRVRCTRTDLDVRGLPGHLQRHRDRGRTGRADRHRHGVGHRI